MGFLKKLLGFLIYDKTMSGMCRAYKALRSDTGGVVYEENDVFHVSHIADMFMEIWET